MKGDAFFFLGIFIFIFVVWAATSGPTRPISFSGPFLTPLTATGETHGYYISKEYLSKGYSPDGMAGSSGNSTQDVNYQIQQAQTSADQLKAKLAALEKFGDPSPYKNKVYIGQRPYSGSTADPSQEYLTLQLSSSATSSVNITGWTIESTVTGKSQVLPAGTTVPMSGLINAIEPVRLSPGDLVYIITGSSPIGASFRTNMCIGYFAQYQKFSPSLSNTCPSPVDEARRVLSDLDSDSLCRTYLDTVPRCTIPTKTPVNMTSGCTNFIQNDLNYNGCVSLHKNQSDFNGSYWYVYLGRTTLMWKSQYETIKLLDAQGLTVAMYSY